MRETEVDEGCKLDDRYKDERERYRLFNDRYDNEDSKYGNCTYDLEVVTRRIYHVLCAGCFTYEQPAFVVLLEYCVELIDLVVYRIACYLIFGVHEDKLPFVAYERIL